MLLFTCATSTVCDQFFGGTYYLARSPCQFSRVLYSIAYYIPNTHTHCIALIDAIDATRKHTSYDVMENDDDDDGGKMSDGDKKEEIVKNGGSIAHQNGVINR